LTGFVQVIERELEDMSGAELLEHVGELGVIQRRSEVAVLRAAGQHAILHNPESIDPDLAKLNGAERMRRYGGIGTPPVAEFAAAEFGARLGVSSSSGRELIGSALDLMHRLPELWRRVQALEVKASYARYVSKQTRELSLEHAMYVDGRVVESADGRIPWSRFEELVAAAIIAADPAAAKEREDEAARRQFAKATRSAENGIRGFYVRANFAIIARLEAMVAFFADALAALGDTSSVDERRVKAVLILANPHQAMELMQAFAAWKDRPADPPVPTDDDPAEEPDTNPDDDPAQDEPAQDESPDEEPAGENPEGEKPAGGKPNIDWGKLLPTVVLYLHLYGGKDTEGVTRVEGLGTVTESWVGRHLGDLARFKITPVLDLAGQAPVDAYEIPDRHRQAVHLMTPADTFPFATCTSRKMQVDHTVPYDHTKGPGSGQSRVGNYGPMTTTHHRIKTHGRWQVQQPFPGIYVWRDPHGAYYLVDHTGTRRINPDQTKARPESRLETYLGQILLAS
jgi:hypothetical protein